VRYTRSNGRATGEASSGRPASLAGVPGPIRRRVASCRPSHLARGDGIAGSGETESRNWGVARSPGGSAATGSVRAGSVAACTRSRGAESVILAIALQWDPPASLDGSMTQSATPSGAGGGHADSANRTTLDPCCARRPSWKRICNLMVVTDRPNRRPGRGHGGEE